MPIVIAAIVIVIIFNGIFNSPINPKIKRAVNMLGKIAIKANFILLNKIESIINITINTKPRVRI